MFSSNTAMELENASNLKMERILLRDIWAEEFLER